MATYISHSPAETEALGEAWGRVVESGLVIGLSGDLGAGKTQLVKGLARGLGIAARVQSPSFALVNIYAGGRLTLFHLDLYRLDTREQIIGAGLEDYLRPAGVTVIEWTERWFGERRQETGDRRQEGEVHGPQFTVHGPQSTVHGPQMPVTAGQLPVSSYPEHFRWVRIEALSETERRIVYEDIGA